MCNLAKGTGRLQRTSVPWQEALLGHQHQQHHWYTSRLGRKQIPINLDSGTQINRLLLLWTTLKFKQTSSLSLCIFWLTHRHNCVKSLGTNKDDCAFLSFYISKAISSWQKQITVVDMVKIPRPHYSQAANFNFLFFLNYWHQITNDTRELMQCCLDLHCLCISRTYDRGTWNLKLSARWSVLTIVPEGALMHLCFCAIALWLCNSALQLQ